jgi:hypothetical protein
MVLKHSSLAVAIAHWALQLQSVLLLSGPEPQSRLRMQLGLNHLADLTHAEYKAHYLGYRADLREGRNASTGLGAAPFRYENASPPEHVDWVKAGAVTKVKNQQQVRF